MTEIITTDCSIRPTDARLRAAQCPEGKSEIALRDTEQPGLRARIRESGAVSFYFKRGAHKVYIAAFPEITVAEARRQAAQLAAQRAQGVDLIAAKRAQKQAAIRARREQDEANKRAANIVISQSQPKATRSIALMRWHGGTTSRSGTGAAS